MKFQNLLLFTTLSLGTVLSKKIDYSYSTKNLKYNFSCLEDNRGICKFLEKELYEAVHSISKIIDIEVPAKFEAFVDDLSKHRIDTKKETLALLLNDDFEPINTGNSVKDNNIISPYPNSKAILRKLNKEKKNHDFILVLNNFKSNKKYLNEIKNDFDSSIIMEIFDGLKALELVGYPYVGTFSPDIEELDQVVFLPKRKDIEKMNATAEKNSKLCSDIVNGDKLNKVVHWEDTLISKEKVNKKIEKGRNLFPYNKNNGLNRIVALGDIHGDYEHLITVLRHAKLIDRKNNWIGKDSILIQMGDLIDRGNSTKKVYDTLMDLREQAKKKGGIVYMLIGNHDVLALQGLHAYTTKKDIESFGGIEGLEKAFGPDGKYGKFIRNEMNMTMMIDDTVYIHGGLRPNFAAEGIDNLNKRARDILVNTPTVEEIYQIYLKNLTQPLHNLTHPILSDPLFNLPILPDKGPLWSRFYADKSESEMCSELEESLKLVKAKRMIVGHAVQPYGKIQTKCQNKLILVDVGISRCINSGGYYAYLEILNDKKEIWARYIKH